MWYNVPLHFPLNLDKIQFFILNIFWQHFKTLTTSSFNHRRKAIVPLNWKLYSISVSCMNTTHSHNRLCARDLILTTLIMILWTCSKWSISSLAKAKRSLLNPDSELLVIIVIALVAAFVHTKHDPSRFPRYFFNNIYPSWIRW
jgi:hypothetical protein